MTDLKMELIKDPVNQVETAIDDIIEDLVNQVETALNDMFEAMLEEISDTSRWSTDQANSIGSALSSKGSVMFTTLTEVRKLFNLPPSDVE